MKKTFQTAGIVALALSFVLGAAPTAQPPQTTVAQAPATGTNGTDPGDVSGMMNGKILLSLIRTGR